MHLSICHLPSLLTDPCVFSSLHSLMLSLHSVALALFLLSPLPITIRLPKNLSAHIEVLSDNGFAKIGIDSSTHPVFAF